jgi:hypothetical protein
MTARRIIESRLGRPLGPLATMPPDLRAALYALAKELAKTVRPDGLAQIEGGKGNGEVS